MGRPSRIVHRWLWPRTIFQACRRVTVTFCPLGSSIGSSRGGSACISDLPLSGVANLQLPRKLRACVDAANCGRAVSAIVVAVTVAVTHPYLAGVARVRPGQAPRLPLIADRRRHRGSAVKGGRRAFPEETRSALDGGGVPPGHSASHPRTQAQPGSFGRLDSSASSQLASPSLVHRYRLLTCGFSPR
jgi:hypothetical protein